MSENLDRVCEALDSIMLDTSTPIPDKVAERLAWATAVIRNEFAELERKAASAIIPTPELREAAEFVCKAADAYYGVGVTFRSQPIAIAAVRAAFKEKDNA